MSPQPAVSRPASATSSSSAPGSSGSRSPASSRGATTDSGSRCSSASRDRRPPDRPLERRHPRRHLLPARLAEGAALRRRGARALRVLRRARDRGRALGQADRRDGARRSCRGSTSSSAAGARTGCPGLRRVGRRGDRARSSRTPPGIAALHSPATGVVDFAEVAAALRRRSRRRRRHGHRSAAASSRSTTPPAGRSIAHAARDAPRRGAVVVCAGAWSDRLAVAAGADADPRIVPFRGAYLRLRPRARASSFGRNIYPVPDPDLPFLGAHLTRTIDGEVLLGPSALMVGARDAYRLSRLRGRATSRDTLAWPGTWRLVRRHWRTGLIELRRAASRERAFVAEARRLRPRAARRRLRRRDRPGSARRRSAATARWSTTSSSPRPSARSTSATPPRRRRPRRWRSRG